MPEETTKCEALEGVINKQAERHFNTLKVVGEIRHKVIEILSRKAAEKEMIQTFRDIRDMIDGIHSGSENNGG
jgi:hypothetical protein